MSGVFNEGNITSVELYKPKDACTYNIILYALNLFAKLGKLIGQVHTPI